jgi:AcrR family transcriptional regulator
MMESATTTTKTMRADARRNREKLLVAAQSLFTSKGPDAPLESVAQKAGVGVGTLYRHFPTRADLVVAVYRHQVEACAEADLTGLGAYAALARWIDLFVDFLVTKHGLAAALRPDSADFAALHTYFLDRLLPVCARLLEAAAAAGEIRADVQAYELMRGVGNLCIGAEHDPGYDARRLVGLLVAGLRS